MEKTLSWLGNKWTYQILKIIDYETICTYSFFLTKMPTINHTLLSDRLKEGVELGIIEKNETGQYQLHTNYFSLVPDLHDALKIIYSNEDLK